MRLLASLFRTFILRDLTRHWAGTAITLVGITIGVSVVLAIHLATHSVLEKFRESVRAVAGNANLEIRPSAAPFIEQSVLSDISWLTMIGGKYTPLIEQSVLLSGDSAEFVQLLGVDMLSDPDFRTYREKRGDKAKPPEDELVVTDPDDPLNADPSRIVYVGARLAQRHGLKIGSRLDLGVDNKIHRLTVTGILTGSGLGGAFSGDLVMVDIDTAQFVLGQPGKIDQIEIIVPVEDVEQAREKLVAQLPQNLTVSSPLQHGKQVEEMTASFQFNLNSLSFIALVVGLFLIYNTMTICVIRRRVEIGTLRALGLSRWCVMLLFTLAALVFGMVGTSFGIIVGLLLAKNTLKAMSSTVHYFYFQMPMDTVSLNWPIISTVFAAAVGLTILAAVPPVMEASLVAPAMTTRRSSQELNVHRFSAVLALVGTVLLILAGVAFSQGPLGNQPLFGHIGTLLSMMACALVSPLALKLVLGPISVLLRTLFGAEGKIAVLSLYGALGRTVIVVASLMVAIAMMVTMTVMIHSFRITVETWLNQTFKADLCLQSLARVKGSRKARVEQRMLLALGTVPAVAAVAPFVELPIEYEGRATVLAGADFDVEARFGHLGFTSGQPSSSVCKRVRGNRAIVSESFAIKHGIKEGDELTIPTAGEPTRVKVEGIYYDYSSDRGYIVIPRALFQDLFHDDSITSCAIYLKEGSDAGIVRSDIVRRIGTNAPVIIQTTKELYEESMKIFDRTFAVTNALLGIAIVIAVLTITNALFALTMESRREFGILRYLGASTAQLSEIVLLQAGVLGFLGSLWGTGLGLLLASFLIVIVNRQSFGWTVHMSLPIDFLIQSTIALTIMAIVAGIVPARLAARTIAPEVVRDE